MRDTTKKTWLGMALVASALVATPLCALAQEDPMLRDLEGKNPHVLAPDEVKALMPGARVSRLNRKSGNTVYWTNDDGGKLFATSDNKSRGSAAATTSPGTWNLTDDGRYCVLINYRLVAAEQWCRFIVKTDDGYYAVTSTSSGTTTAHPLDIRK